MELSKTIKYWVSLLDVFPWLGELVAKQALLGGAAKIADWAYPINYWALLRLMHSANRTTMHRTAQTTHYGQRGFLEPTPLWVSRFETPRVSSLGLKRNEGRSTALGRTPTRASVYEFQTYFERIDAWLYSAITSNLKFISIGTFPFYLFNWAKKKSFAYFDSPFLSVPWGTLIKKSKKNISPHDTPNVSSTIITIKTYTGQRQCTHHELTWFEILSVYRRVLTSMVVGLIYINIF